MAELLQELDFVKFYGYVSHMKIANISYTKNHLSELIEGVKAGETIIIQERNHPVARLVPWKTEATEDDRIRDLARQGLVRLPERPLNSKEFHRRRLPRLPKRSSAVQIILDERAEGR